MAKIQIFKSEGTPWVMAKPGPSSESGDSSRVRHPGGQNELQLFDVRVGPHRQAEVHTHEQDEIIYVVGGQMIFGQHTLNPGDSVYVPGMTLYSFKAGAQGLQFINFRPCKDITYFNKDQFMALQKMEGEERARYREELIRARRAQVGWD